MFEVAEVLGEFYTQDSDGKAADDEGDDAADEGDEHEALLHPDEAPTFGNEFGSHCSLLLRVN